ncbi:hypothetical protein EV1_041892 [Malus domestica]
MQAILRRIVNRDDLKVFAEFWVVILVGTVGGRGMFSELIDVLGLSDDEFGISGFDLLENLGRGVEGVGGGGNGADQGSAHKSEDELCAVLKEDHDDVAFLDAEIGEAGAGLLRNEVGLGERV